METIVEKIERLRDAHNDLVNIVFVLLDLIEHPEKYKDESLILGPEALKVKWAHSNDQR